MDARRLSTRGGSRRSPAAPARAQGRRHAGRRRRRRCPRRGRGDRASSREPSRARLSARPTPGDRRLGRIGDGTDETVQALAERDARVSLARRPREGKTAAQDAVVGEIASDVVAFSDANSLWEPDALRKLVRSFADPEVGYVCGRLELQRPDGTQPRASLLALRALGAGVRKRSRRRHCRERRHLRSAPRELPRQRPPDRPRSGLPVSHGSTGSPSRVRAGRSRRRARVERSRGRARAAAPDACPGLAARAQRTDAAAVRPALSGRARVAPGSPLRKRPPPRDPVRDERCPRSAARRSTAWRLARN